MVVNPCCMPLKTGVKIVTHVSMALAIAVGGMGIRLISISAEVNNSPYPILWGESSYLEHGRQQHPSITKPVTSIQDSSAQDIFPPPRHQTHFLHPNLTDLEEYAHVLLMCGLLALSAVFFQFMSSFLLLCFVEKEGNAPAQIWTAVNCGVIFCLCTCLILFICQDTWSVYSFDEKFFLCLITVDALLSIYFLWVVMAFI